MYLYWHSLELLVKGLLGNAPKTHDLAALADELAQAHFNRWQTLVPSWIVDRLKEIAAIDPGSTAFRYGENYDRVLKADVPPLPSAMM